MVHIARSKKIGHTKREEEELKRLERAKRGVPTIGETPLGPVPLPEEEPKPTEQPRTEQQLPQIILKDGRPAGVVLPSGKTLLGLSRTEALFLAQRHAPFVPPEGTVEAEAFGRGEEQLRRNQLLAQQIEELTGTPTGEFQPSELAGTRQTRLVALQGAAEKAISQGLNFAKWAGGTALVAGQLGPQVAAPEEIVTVPLAAAGGFVVGTITGGIQGYLDARSGSIKSQAEGFVGAKAKTLRSTKTVMTRSLSNAWGGRGDKEDASIMFEKNWNDALDAWGQLQVDTQNDVQLRRGVDGTTTLQMYLEFFKEDGQGQQFRDEMKLALVSAPDLERSIFWTNQADINQLTPLPE